MNSKQQYYVYGLIDPKNNEIFYIGKGKGDRAFDHFTEQLQKGKGNKSKIKRIDAIQEKGKQPIIKYYAKNLDEESAFILEKCLIERIGRLIFKHGPLTNILEGGENDFLSENHEKINLKYIKYEYPKIYDVINDIPYTSKEYEINQNNKRITNKIIEEINSYDANLWKDIEMHSVSFLSHPRGEAIKFESIIGRGEIFLVEDEIFETSKMGSSSIIFRVNKEIVYNSVFQFRKDVPVRVREFYKIIIIIIM
jgi:hypothetical protein